MRRVLQVTALAFAVGALGILSCSAQQSARRGDTSQAGPQGGPVRVGAGVYPAPAPRPMESEYVLPATKAGPVFLERSAPPPQAPQQQAQAR
jgi:hypothetical protein